MACKPNAVSVAAKVFLSELPKNYADIFDGQIHMAGQYFICNGNALYVGCQIPNITEVSPVRSDLLIAIMRQCLMKGVYREKEERIVLDVSAIRETLENERKRMHEAGHRYSRHTATYIMTTQQGNQVGFDCERMLTDFKLLGGKDVTISLPNDMTGVAQIHGPNGIVFQCCKRV